MDERRLNENEIQESAQKVLNEFLKITTAILATAGPVPFEFFYDKKIFIILFVKFRIFAKSNKRFGKLLRVLINNKQSVTHLILKLSLILSRLQIF